MKNGQLQKDFFFFTYLRFLSECVHSLRGGGDLPTFDLLPS